MNSDNDMKMPRNELVYNQLRGIWRNYDDPCLTI